MKSWWFLGAGFFFALYYSDIMSEDPILGVVAPLFVFFFGIALLAKLFMVISPVSSIYNSRGKDGGIYVTDMSLLESTRESEAPKEEQGV